MASAKCCPFSLGLNVLRVSSQIRSYSFPPQIFCKENNYYTIYNEHIIHHITGIMSISIPVLPCFLLTIQLSAGNALTPKQIGIHFANRIFLRFRAGGLVYIASNFIEICFHKSNLQKASFSAGNGLVPNRQNILYWQAMTYFWPMCWPLKYTLMINLNTSIKYLSTMILAKSSLRLLSG